MVQKLNLFFVSFLFIILVNVSLISAVQPTQISGTLTVGYPKIDILPQNLSHTFRFHLFNDTSFISNVSGQCGVTFMNPDGTVVYKNMSINYVYGTENEWQVKLTSGNFSQIGQHSLAVECNTSAQAGFVSIPIQVTPSGHEFTTGTAIIESSLLLLMVLIFIGGAVGTSFLPSANERDEEGKLISISWLKYLRGSLWFVEYILFVAILYMASNLAFAFLAEGLFANVLFVLYRITFRLAPVIVIIWIAWIFVKIFQDKQFWGMMQRGMFPQGKM